MASYSSAISLAITLPFSSALAGRLCATYLVVLSGLLLILGGCTSSSKNDNHVSSEKSELQTPVWELKQFTDITRLISDEQTIRLDVSLKHAPPGNVQISIGDRPPSPSGQIAIKPAALGIGEHKVRAHFSPIIKVTANDEANVEQAKQKTSHALAIPPGPTCLITINPDLPPRISLQIPEQLSFRDIEPHQLDILAEARDPENKPLTYYTQINGEQVSSSKRAAISINTASLDVGEHQLELIVNDGYNSTTSEVVTVTITSNNAPVFSHTPAVPAALSFLTPDSVTLQFLAEDVDGDTITYILMRDGKAIESNTTGAFEIHTIADIISSDSYQCIADDGSTQVSSDVIIVQTYDPTLEPVAIDDPALMGERLALRQWLKENNVNLAPETTIQELRKHYLIASDPSFEERRETVALERDRLRRHLRKTYDHTPDVSASIMEMKRMVFYFEQQALLKQ